MVYCKTLGNEIHDNHTIPVLLFIRCFIGILRIQRLMQLLADILCKTLTYVLCLFIYWVQCNSSSLQSARKKAIIAIGIH